MYVRFAAPIEKLVRFAHESRPRYCCFFTLGDITLNFQKSSVPMAGPWPILHHIDCAKGSIKLCQNRFSLFLRTRRLQIPTHVPNDPSIKLTVCQAYEETSYLRSVQCIVFDDINMKKLCHKNKHAQRRHDRTCHQKEVTPPPPNPPHFVSHKEPWIRSKAPHLSSKSVNSF